MITGFNYFKVYTTAKLHFTSKYDAFKYTNTPSQLTKELYQSKKEFNRFEFQSRNFGNLTEALDLCVFNFSEGNENWFYDDFSIAQKTYYKKLGLFSSLSKYVDEDMVKIKEVMSVEGKSFKELCDKTNSGKQPPLLQMLLRNKINKESLCIFDGVGANQGFLQRWYDNNKIDPLITKTLGICLKYKPFVLSISKR